MSLAEDLKVWAIEHDSSSFLSPPVEWMQERTDGDYRSNDVEFLRYAVFAIRALAGNFRWTAWAALDTMLGDLTDPSRCEYKSLGIGLLDTFAVAVDAVDWRGELFLQLVAWAVTGDLEQRYPMRRCRNPKCKLPGGMFAPRRSDQTACSRACAMGAHRAKKGRDSNA